MTHDPPTPAAGPPDDDKPSRRRFQLRLIAELLLCGTVDEAAARAGISRSTAQRWMKQPGFQNRYRQAREAAVSAAVGLLHNSTSSAVQELAKILASDVTPPAVKIQAANAVLGWAAKFGELLDVRARLAALERKAKQKKT
ncbi:helix-turn-helix domain-containing protein [Limnoglobus roseus]|uniref:Homeodomain phBC6A51-type domain-containing protein n=1 Tax=Limnoglobus roseus TaxID=2598579 RepID=A0A5C1AIH9_9BACT|nr:helix-turn-helix domain-containing protein [Limnoglobus roseus]QEL18650.1 hypothetical protein PX52LOC_05683 [Limnoglobus roseus]